MVSAQHAPVTEFLGTPSGHTSSSPPPDTHGCVYAGAGPTHSVGETGLPNGSTHSTVRTRTLLTSPLGDLHEQHGITRAF